MNRSEPVVLKRDVLAVMIPYGEKMSLPAGSGVTVHQVLGGNFTVVTDRGMMVRIEGRDADALGLEPPKSEPESAGGAATDRETVEKKVWEQLRTCYDPEIPVDIVELGLVYECQLVPFPAGGFHVEVKMTLTAPGCGMGDVLKEDAKRKIESIPGVGSANVEVVFEPPWDPSRMTEAARLHLGMF